MTTFSCLVALKPARQSSVPSSPMQAGDTIELLMGRLITLRDRGLIALADSRIQRSQDGRILGAGPCNLTPAGRQALEQDRRLRPRS